MKIEELIKLIDVTVKKLHGNMYTGKNLSDNPDVCHACCTWFLAAFEKKKPLKDIVDFLDKTGKDTFKLAQEQVSKGVKQPKAVLEIVMKSNKNITKEDKSAIEAMIAHYSQPKTYKKDKMKVVAEITEAMRTKEDRLLIYIRGKGGGHVICIARNVGGVAIYDPNIGIITAALKDTDTWGGVLTMILGWYEKEMKLDEFAFLAK